MEEFCELVNEGWALKRNLGEGITNDRVEGIISVAMKNGSRAARLLGGGAQGFILLIAGDSRISELQRRMMSVSKFVIRVSLRDQKRFLEIGK